MVAKDPAWDIFRTELIRWMDKTDQPTTAGELAALLAQEPALKDFALDGLDVAVIHRWRRKTNPTTPPLAALEPIARVLLMTDSDEGEPDPFYLARKMGIVAGEVKPGKLTETAYRLAKLETKLYEAQDRAVSLGRSSGAASVVTAALATGAYAVAVYPAMEGPSGFEMHVADRMDIRRTDDGPIDRKQIWEQPELKTALRATWAVVADRQPRWSRPSDPVPCSRWSISHVGSPRGAIQKFEHHDMQALSISALTVQSWVNDVAWVTGLLIGYGFTSTRDLAIDISGEPAPGEEWRRQVHDDFLYDAVPRRRVWSHYSHVLNHGGAPFVNDQGRVHPRVAHVRLIESDELLRDSANRSKGGPGPAADAHFELCVRSRKAARITADNAPVPNMKILQLRVDYYEHPTQRWQQVFDCVEQTLAWLSQEGIVRNLKQVHDRVSQLEPRTGGQFLRWLSARNPTLLHDLQN